MWIPFSRKSRSARSAYRTVSLRPRLEVLEDRTLLSAYLVTTTADTGPGSLRDAILQVNADTGHSLYASLSDPSKDEIDFQIGSGVQTITPLSALPAITNAVILDGTTQTVFAGSPAIVLNGSSAGAGVDGLDITGGNSTVRGLAIDGFSGSGIVLSGGGNDVIAGNYIGTDATGMMRLANGLDGVRVFSSNNLIGGSATADRNVLSGNGLSGVRITGAAGNQVEGNIIGLDASGSTAWGTDGNRLGNHGAGVFITGGATGNTVGGLTSMPGTGAGNVISGNVDLDPVSGDAAGVMIWDPTNVGTSDNVVEGNLIGLDRTGTKTVDANGASLGNVDGVRIVYANHITIGGTVQGAGNVISNNSISGVTIDASSYDVVAGNYIGTDVTGEVAMGNAYDFGGPSGGIWLQVLNSNILIGGATPAARNVISGNAKAGISVGGGASNTHIEGNYIGTDASGNVALGNERDGIDVDGGVNNVIGGLTSTPGTGPGNVISGNHGRGVVFTAGDRLLSGNVLQGNLIGLAANGNPLGNDGNGVVVNYGTGANTTIGGTVSGAANVISANGRDPNRGTAGVLVTDSSTGNAIRGNSIYGNSGLGIDLMDATIDTLGVTLNDSAGHVGGNNFQNFPVLTSAIFGTGTRVTGSLLSTPNTTFFIDFYGNPSGGDPSGYGEGQVYLGSTTVATNSTGFAPINVTGLGATALGEIISATATDSVGNTSEFSANITAQPIPLTVNTNSSIMLVGNNPPPLTGIVNGTPFTGSITYATAFGDQVTVTLSTTATSGSPVGQYAITAALSGASADNYVIDPATSHAGTMYVVSLGADPSTSGAESVVFWDNKANAKLITAADLSSLDALNLVNQGGNAFDPKAVAQLQAWLSISPNATTSYQLAVQLAVMDLNVLAGYVHTTDLVYAGALLQYGTAYGITGLTSGGFISVQNLMNAANAILALDPRALTGDPNQPYEAALTQVLQAANLDNYFVQQELTWNLTSLYQLLTN